MRQRPPEAVEAPHHQHVSCLKVAQTPCQLWPVVSSSGKLVAVDRVATRCPQRVELKIEILSPCTYSRVPTSHILMIQLFETVMRDHAAVIPSRLRNS